jgi:hypothetical protein
MPLFFDPIERIGRSARRDCSFLLGGFCPTALRFSGVPAEGGFFRGVAFRLFCPFPWRKGVCKLGRLCYDASCGAILFRGGCR